MSVNLKVFIPALGVTKVLRFVEFFICFCVSLDRCLLIVCIQLYFIELVPRYCISDLVSQYWLRHSSLRLLCSKRTLCCNINISLMDFQGFQSKCPSMRLVRQSPRKSTQEAKTIASIRSPFVSFVFHASQKITLLLTFSNWKCLCSYYYLASSSIWTQHGRKIPYSNPNLRVLWLEDERKLSFFIWHFFFFIHFFTIQYIQ